MRIDIFDVGHGACALITSPNGRRMMIDCGSNPERSWWPSVQYMGQVIDVLAISNYDEDHVEGFPSLSQYCTVLRYQLNKSITAQALAHMKAKGGMGPGIAALHSCLSIPGADILFPPLDFSPVQYRVYHNTYGIDFTDTNNLSLVLIVEYAGYKIIFPGDLQKEGWNKLLENTAFAQDLVGVNVFVASHHGRITGCCEEVFNIWKPEIVIMSDKDKEFDSQETVPWYRQRALGIKHGTQDKYVYTTRSNGHMTIAVTADGKGTIYAEKSK